MRGTTHAAHSATWQPLAAAPAAPAPRAVQKFRPVTAELPKALLPLVNAPMIEYALEWLAAAGVEKVHLLCCAHADQVAAYIERSAKWRSGASDMDINVIVSYNCRSAGEALRLVEQQGLVTDDFVLLSCDCVTNMDLGAALAAHKRRRCAPCLFCRNAPCLCLPMPRVVASARHTSNFHKAFAAPGSWRTCLSEQQMSHACREKDKAAIMTVVCSSGVDEPQRITLGAADLAVAMDRDTSRLLAYVNFADGTGDPDTVRPCTTRCTRRRECEALHVKGVMLRYTRSPRLPQQGYAAGQGTCSPTRWHAPHKHALR
jgi:Nucleotidyl transferase